MEEDEAARVKDKLVELLDAGPDMQELTEKKLRHQIEEALGVDMENPDMKKLVKKELQQWLENQDNEDGGDSGDNEDDNDKEENKHSQHKNVDSKEGKKQPKQQQDGSEPAESQSTEKSDPHATNRFPPSCSKRQAGDAMQDPNEPPVLLYAGQHLEKEKEKWKKDAEEGDSEQDDGGCKGEDRVKKAKEQPKDDCQRKMKPQRLEEKSGKDDSVPLFAGQHMENNDDEDDDGDEGEGNNKKGHKRKAHHDKEQAEDDMREHDGEVQEDNMKKSQKKEAKAKEGEADTREAHKELQHEKDEADDKKDKQQTLRHMKEDELNEDDDMHEDKKNRSKKRHHGEEEVGDDADKKKRQKHKEKEDENEDEEEEEEEDEDIEEEPMDDAGEMVQAPAGELQAGRMVKPQQNEDAAMEANAEAIRHKRIEQEEEAKLQKTRGANGQDEIIVCEMGKRRATVSPYKGTLLLSLREYYERDGKMCPGKKGISLKKDEWKILQKHIDDVNSAFQSYISTGDDAVARNLKKIEGDDGRMEYLICEMGKRRVTVYRWQKIPMVNIREYYEKNGKLLPGPKGIVLTHEQWHTLSERHERVDKAMTMFEK